MINSNYAINTEKLGYMYDPIALMYLPVIKMINSKIKQAINIGKKAVEYSSYTTDDASVRECLSANERMGRDADKDIDQIIELHSKIVNQCIHKIKLEDCLNQYMYEDKITSNNIDNLSKSMQEDIVAGILTPYACNIEAHYNSYNLGYEYQGKYSRMYDRYMNHLDTCEVEISSVNSIGTRLDHSHDELYIN